jgi:hypothetical protein
MLSTKNIPAEKRPENRQGKWRIAAQLSAAVLGGYGVATLLHLALALGLPDPQAVVVTFGYSLYLVWAALFILPFFFRNAWKCWALYLGLMALLGAAILIGTKFQLPA